MKFKLLVGLIIFCHLFSANLAWACSPRRSFNVVGRCTPDGKEKVLLSLPGFPADFEGDLALLHTQLNEFAQQCEVAQVTTEQVRELFTAWTNRYSPDGEELIYENNTLIIEAYSPEREAELKTAERALHLCSYYKAERVADWLVLNFQDRSARYCGIHIFSLCDQIVYLVPFLAYLITQPSPAAVPYLLLFVLFTGLGTTFFYQLLHHKLINLGCLVNLFLVTPVILCLLFISPQQVQLAGWFFSCYLLAYGWHSFQVFRQQKGLAKII